MQLIRTILLSFLFFSIIGCSELPPMFWTEKTKQHYAERVIGVFKTSNCIDRDYLNQIPELIPEQLVKCLVVGNIFRPSKIGDAYFEKWVTFFLVKKNGYINEYDRERKLVSKRKYIIKPGFICTDNQCFKILLDKDGWLGVKSGNMTYMVTRGDTTFYKLY